MCCNPAKGRVEFEDGWLIKPSFITKGRNESLSANQDQNPTTKQNKKTKDTSTVQCNLMQMK
jgi:hypothetical protein